MIHPSMLRVDGTYYWTGQKEHLVYMGTARLPNGKNTWYQFALVDNPGVVWSEVLEGQLQSLGSCQMEVTDLASLNPACYDTVEVHPVKRMEPDLLEVCAREDAEMWSVYLHRRSGGVRCVADFRTEELANRYGLFLEEWLVVELEEQLLGVTGYKIALCDGRVPADKPRKWMLIDPKDTSGGYISTHGSRKGLVQEAAEKLGLTVPQ